jgi:hypothetical protein
MATIQVTGYYGDDHNRSLEGRVSISYTARGAGGNLSVSFPGTYRADLPYSPIAHLAREVRVAASRLSPHQTVELRAVAEGFLAIGGSRLLPAAVTIWLRRRRAFEVLTVECGSLGQISVPYRAVEELVKRERRNLV